MPAKKLGKREAKKMLTDMFEEVAKCKGKECADKFLLGSGELAERLTDGEETGGNAKQFFSGVGKGLLGLGSRGGVAVAGSCQSRGGVKVAGSSSGCARKGAGKDKKAGKVIGKVLSLGLGKKPKKSTKTGDKRKARGDVIRAVMREKGMSLPEASHFVKVNNLF